MNDKQRRAIHVIMLTIGTLAVGFIYQYFRETPDWEAALERGYFSAIQVPIVYWYCRWVGWIKQ
jgi:hypothetical protein